MSGRRTQLTLGPEPQNSSIPENESKLQRIHSLTLFQGANRVTTIPTNAEVRRLGDSKSDGGDNGDGGRKDDSHTLNSPDTRHAGLLAVSAPRASLGSEIAWSPPTECSGYYRNGGVFLGSVSFQSPVQQ